MANEALLWHGRFRWKLNVKQQRALHEQIVVVTDHKKTIFLVPREPLEVIDAMTGGEIERGNVGDVQQFAAFGSGR